MMNASSIGVFGTVPAEDGRRLGVDASNLATGTDEMLEIEAVGEASH